MRATRCLVLVPLLLLIAVAASAQPAAVEAAGSKLQGAWTATRAERDGKAAEDVVGNRLTFSGSRFEIRSGDGKSLYAGTVRLDPNAKPAAIDFVHGPGPLEGKTWKGIYVVEGGTLTTCDDAPNLGSGRPSAFQAPSGSGHVLIRFERAKP